MSEIVSAKPTCAEADQTVMGSGEVTALCNCSNHSYNFVQLDRDSDGVTSQSTDSKLSFQLYETASLHDTSDTSSKTDSSAAEYTVAEASEEIFSDFSSSPEDLSFLEEDIQYVPSESEGLADLSDMDLSPSSKVGLRAQGVCAQCGSTSKSPHFSLCIRCFRERKTLLPPRPRKRRRTDSVKSHLQTTEDAEPNMNTIFATSGNLCGCCLSRPVNAVFQHGCIAHEVYCFQCSQRVLKARKMRCPCCNRISKVLKVFRGEDINETESSSFAVSINS